ncbi:MAG: leucine-rich repeat domain-containing protein, partial [Clostridia bacterium]|nr:leucine-rich repeat domain-containing protein [Clostridia bacterium]
MKSIRLLLTLLLAGTVLCSLAACENTDKTPDTTTTKDFADTVLTPSEELHLELSPDGSAYQVTSVGNCTDRTVVIPATFEGKPVTVIGEAAFFRCQTVEEVVIPEGITTIETCAFTECTKLARVKLLDSLTNIGISAFLGCKQLKEITIPKNVRRIDREAFSECDNLDSIVFEAADRWYSADHEGSGSGEVLNL